MGNYGLQLYSIRDAVTEDFGGAMKLVSEYGYENVELFGREISAMTADAAREALAVIRANGLRVSGMHTSLAVLREQLDEAAEVMKAMDCDRLILAWSKPETAREAAELAVDIEQWRVVLAEKGVRLGYHNHAQEFEPIEGGRRMIDYLLEDTNVYLEIDTYWVYKAGEDPVAWMEKVSGMGRLPVIHIKDGLADGTGKPLGLGTAPYQKVWAKARELGVEMVVESETQTPSGPEEIRICAEALRALEG